METTQQTTNETKPADSQSRGRQKGRQKEREGLVVSNKMQKTVVVAVVRQVKHGRYGKFVRRTSRFHAHDADNSCGVGDLVRIEETRPMSKLKRWKVVQIVRKAVNA